MIEKLLAGLTVAVCISLLVRLCLGAPRRQRFDAVVRCAWAVVRRAAATVWYWRSRRRAAVRAAEEAISRARADVQRDGNVYKPKSFRDRGKPH